MEKESRAPLRVMIASAVRNCLQVHGVVERVSDSKAVGVVLVVVMGYGLWSAAVVTGRENSKGRNVEVEGGGGWK
ncbi:hypothetical protein SAMD00023353_0202450 [Rosellinia necatrix]|uniref:Uncharacterized protein n=1 Tax=Rosellinia necatrix TaxID=77044 RepID=A0A1S8A5J9_ROSNE|nr:hypothetical protein SAMD00023353_0202450 [Rosellinia necatrix]